MREAPAGAGASRLGVAGKLPRHRLATIGRHAVVLRDGSSGRRCPDHLPDSALGAGLTGVCSRSDRLLHGSYSFDRLNETVPGRSVRVLGPGRFAERSASMVSRSHQDQPRARPCHRSRLLSFRHDAHASSRFRASADPVKRIRAEDLIIGSEIQVRVAGSVVQIRI